MFTNVDAELTTKIQAALAAALQIPVEQVTPDLSFGDLPQWDSMGHMEVMLRLEEHFGVETNPDTIAALTSFHSICTYSKENGHA